MSTCKTSIGWSVSFGKLTLDFSSPKKSQPLEAIC